MNDILYELRVNTEAFEKALSELFNECDSDLAELYDAMRYSTMSGGKRIRPFLVMTACRCFDGNEKDALRFATALELIHTYSLIHDDLPCMDNDDYRRGKPTCHKVYGESTAMLAGDALLTMAFEIISSDVDISAEKRIKATEILSKASGANGMIGGQIMDLATGKKTPEYETMAKMHSLKTGALIKAACLLGCLAADVNDEKILSDFETYAEGIGRVFQLVDDILDAEKGGSDDVNGRVTYLTFMNRDMADQIAQLITEKAQ